MFLQKKETKTPKTISELTLELAKALTEKSHKDGKDYEVKITSQNFLSNDIQEVKTKFEKRADELKRQNRALRQTKFNSRRAYNSLQKAYLLVKAHRDELLKEVQTLRPPIAKKITMVKQPAANPLLNGWGSSPVANAPIDLTEEAPNGSSQGQ